MSTRAQIIVTDGYCSLWFYRHSDGYPEGAMPLLEKFMNYVKTGTIRDNAEQASGWLVLFGAQEYDTRTSYEDGKIVEVPKVDLVEPDRTDTLYGWKCGSIEPSEPNLHGDIDYLYILDLKRKTITSYNKDFEKHIPQIEART